MRIEFPVSAGNQGLLNVEMCCEHPTLCIYILLAPGCGLLPNLDLFLLWGWGCACTPGQSCDSFAAGSGSAVPHTDRSIPPQNTNGNCTQWFKNTTQPYKHPRSTGSPSEPLWIPTPTAQTTHNSSHSVTPTKNIITCIMIKQSVI